MSQTALEVRRPPVAVASRGVVISDMDGLARLAQCVHKSGLAPKGFGSPEAIAVAIQLGLELGLSPLAALQSIAVINGRPGVYGDTALALVEESGLLADFAEGFEMGGHKVETLPAKLDDSTAAVCYSKRQGRSRAVVTRFSVADAKQAKLWGKEGPWTQYPGRMLKWRARGFNLRDNFPDVLKGLRTVEELRDIPEEPLRGRAARAEPLAVQPPAEAATPQVARGNGSGPKPASAAVHKEIAERMAALTLTDEAARRYLGRWDLETIDQATELQRREILADLYERAEHSQEQPAQAAPESGAAWPEERE